MTMHQVFLSDAFPAGQSRSAFRGEGSRDALEKGMGCMRFKRIDISVSLE